MSVDVAVIGAGVIGASIAWHLARIGADVMLIDGAPTPATWPSASWASAGGLRSQGRSAVESEISVAAARRWSSIEDELGTSVGFRQGGHLHVAETESEAQEVLARVHADRAEGVDIEFVDGADLKDLCPGLTARALAGAWTCADGQAHPALSVRAFATAAERAGAKLRFGEASTLRAADDRFVATVGGETISAGSLVIACGAWSVKISEELGLDAPLRWRGLQMLLSDVAPIALGPTLTAVGRNLSLKQTRGGQYMVGGRWTTMPPVDGKVVPSVDRGRAAVQWSGAAGLWPALTACRLAQVWSGAEAQTADAGPLIGAVDGSGLWLVTGFSGHGFQLAPEIGRLVALALNGAPQSLLAPFDPHRFSDMTPADRQAFKAAS